MSGDFTPDQKRYLEGFVSGLSAARVAQDCAPAAARASPPARRHPHQGAGPHHRGRRQARRSGEVQARPASRSMPIRSCASNRRRTKPPKPADNFRWRYFGLFYVAPAQSSYMCRLRIPNGILTHWQFAGLADVAEKYAGPYSHVTTRANLQLREIEPKNATNVVEAIQDLGLCSRGSGADNIRNVTGTPTAGIDPQELLDTRPACARVAPSHSERPLALRPAAQVQRRLRRRRPDRGAGGHQRHRLPGGRGEGRLRRRARHLVSS